VRFIFELAILGRIKIMVNYLSQEEKLLAAEEEKYLEEEDDVDFPPV